MLVVRLGEGGAYPVSTGYRVTKYISGGGSAGKNKSLRCANTADAARKSILVDNVSLELVSLTRLGCLTHLIFLMCEA